MVVVFSFDEVGVFLFVVDGCGCFVDVVDVECFVLEFGEGVFYVVGVYYGEFVVGCDGEGEC